MSTISIRGLSLQVLQELVSKNNGVLYLLSNFFSEGPGFAAGC